TVRDAEDEGDGQERLYGGDGADEKQCEAPGEEQCRAQNQARFRAGAVDQTGGKRGDEHAHRCQGQQDEPGGAGTEVPVLLEPERQAEEDGIEDEAYSQELGVDPPTLPTSRHGARSATAAGGIEVPLRLGGFMTLQTVCPGGAPGASPVRDDGPILRRPSSPEAG